MEVTGPNILWICSDQQRADTLGCYGNGLVRTPNADALAAGGALFENAFVQSPVCTPSRASFLTGRYPRTTRCRQNGQNMPDDEVLVTRLLANAGYTCGLAGKLHISACHPSVCPGPPRRIDDGYAVFRWSQAPGDEGWTGHDYRTWLGGRGGDVEQPAHPLSPYVRVGRPVGKHQTTWCCEEAIDFIHRRQADGQPWLFSLNMFDPHHSFNPPAEYLALYTERLDEIPLPDYAEGELAGKPPYQQTDHAGAYGGTLGLPFDKMADRDHRMVRAAYWAMCELIDAQVGRVLAALDETDQRDSTIVIFTSDHGEMLGDHGIYLKGPYFYDPLVRVPLLVSWPRHIAPGRIPALVEMVDLAPTLLEACGLPASPGMQGTSLWPMLVGDSNRDHHRDDVYCEYYNAMPFHRNPTAQATMVRTADRKIVVEHAHGSGELYDLSADPGERRNLWDDPEALRLKADMLTRLTHCMARTVDPLPERIAPW